MIFFAGKQLSAESQDRLDAIKDFSGLGAGFKVAQRDLEIRGAGSLLGADQSGAANGVGTELYIQMLRETMKEMREKQLIALRVAAEAAETFGSAGKT